MYYCRYKLYLVRRCIIMTTDLGLTNTKLGFIILPVPNCTEYTIHLIQYICMHFIHFIHCTLHILYDTLGTHLYTVHCTFYTMHYTRALEHTKPACTHNTIETTPVNMIQLKSEISLTAPYTYYTLHTAPKLYQFQNRSLCACKCV